MSHIDGFVQERHNSIVNALELRLSCTNPSICFYVIVGDLRENSCGPILWRIGISDNQYSAYIHCAPIVWNRINSVTVLLRLNGHNFYD